MLDYDKEQDKENMLAEMKRIGWETKLDDKSSYKQVEKEFMEMKEELDSIEDMMYPNGRDFDAENFD